MLARLYSLAFAVLTMGGLALPVNAQDRLFLGDHEVGSHGRFGARIGPRPLEFSAGSLFGGGRYVLIDLTLVNLPGVMAYDRRTGTLHAVPLVRTPILGDPVRPRVYALVRSSVVGDPATIVSIDLTNGVETPFMQLALPTGTSVALKVAVDADRVYATDTFLFGTTPFGSKTGQIEVASPVLGVSSQRRVPIPPLPASGFLNGLWHFDVTPDGARLFAVVSEAGGYTLRAFDVATGGEVVRVASGTAPITWDSSLGGLLVASNSTQLRTRDLQLVADVYLFGCGGGPVVRTSAHTGRVYVLNEGGHYMSQRYDQELRVFDTRTGERSGPANVTRNLSLAWECEQRFDLYTAPGAPNNLRAAVSGRDLTLAWENIGAASGFILEAGFAPGRPALSVHLGPDSTGSFANVPPGTYYVRLRGFNEFGGGRPSNEIRLDIP